MTGGGTYDECQKKIPSRETRDLRLVVGISNGSR